MVTDLPTAVFLLVVAPRVLAALRRRRRADQLAVRLRTGLKLAAEAQEQEWRLERHYTDDTARLAVLRPASRAYLQAEGAEWRLSTTEDGSGFDPRGDDRAPSGEAAWRRDAGRCSAGATWAAHGDSGQISCESLQ